MDMFVRSGAARWPHPHGGRPRMPTPVVLVLGAGCRAARAGAGRHDPRRLARTGEPRERGRPGRCEDRAPGARERAPGPRSAPPATSACPPAACAAQNRPTRPTPPGRRGSLRPIASPGRRGGVWPGAAQEHQAAQGHTRGTTGAEQGHPAPNSTEPQQPNRRWKPTAAHGPPTRLPGTSPEPTGRQPRRHDADRQPPTATKAARATATPSSTRPMPPRSAPPPTARPARQRARTSAAPATSKATITRAIDFHRLALEQCLGC